jgi:hypothetical protein
MDEKLSIYQYPIKGIRIISPKKKPSETDVIIGYTLVENHTSNLFTGCLPLHVHKQYQQPVYANLENLFKNLNTESISIIPRNLSPIYEESCVYV